MIIPLTEIDIAGVKTFFQNFSLIRGPVKYFRLPNITLKAPETLLELIFTLHPSPHLHETYLDAVRGAYLTKRSQPVHQQEELVGAMLLRTILTNIF